MIRRYSALFPVPLVYFFDRAIKKIVLARLSEGEGFPVIPGFFHVTRVNNSGAAFGILRGQLDFLILISAACAAVLGGRIVLRARRGVPADLSDWACALIAGGAIGNLYDRLFYGYVVDYLDFRVWPVFNLADTCITVGTALLVLGAFSKKKA